MNKIQKEVDIMEVKREELQDIDSIQVDKMDLIEKKLEKFLVQSEGEGFTHLNNGYVVKVHFGKEGYTATDAFKQYLRQIAELKY